MKTIDNFNFNGKKALIRVDFNVPLDENYHITDTTRIDAAIPTLKKILGDGGAVILMSHLGRPKEGPAEKYSLKHLLPYLNKTLNLTVKFAGDCIGEEAKEMAGKLKGGEVLLLENLRFYKNEEKGDEEFAAKLAQLGDVYVNDAFGTAHRAHASTAIIAKFFPENKLFGYIMEEEVKAIDKVLRNAERPFTAILGGAKVSGKIEIINNLIDKVDNLLIGGGMMFTFIKALGGEVGSSLVEEDLLQLARETSDKAEANNVKIYIPQDAVIASAFQNDAEKMECGSTAIPEGWMGLDIGPKAIAAYREVILNSKTILWNGPMGVFEMPNFEPGTKAIAEAVAEATQNGAFSLIGGGDSVAAVNKYDLKDQVSYVSTGGGAMLEYIEGKELPGVAAIKGR
ncbi:MAG TPA: phosphoglycerate kinase [Bacteroidales bacterium]|nr:phosphoglycerate kinase [Bacteroidales bacterium]HPI84867.1 phosphoglycerate kinase [Bacteroidales bacterium]HPM92528.1 phosphoglycerate kinase [Bacteroidales bacterium]